MLLKCQAHVTLYDDTAQENGPANHSARTVDYLVLRLQILFIFASLTHILFQSFHYFKTMHLQLRRTLGSVVIASYS